MLCPKCNSENPEDAREGSNCGAKPNATNESWTRKDLSTEPQIPNPNKRTVLIDVLAGLLIFLVTCTAGYLFLKKTNNLSKFKKGTPTNEQTRDARSKNSDQETPTPSPATPTTAPEKDSDNDGLTDGEEEKHGTNPLLSDTDGDGYSDEEEIGAGYDPLADDCAVEVGCSGESSVEAEEDINNLIILDASGSMAGAVTGGTKIEIAKNSIKDYIDQLPEKINAGFMVYGHIGSNSPQDKKESCANPELLYAISELDKAEIKKAVDSFQPRGWTPIAGSLQKAKSEGFSEMAGENNSILLVSDGIETCGGDPCQVAKELKESGIKTTIDVVGFDVNSKAKSQLECISRVSGGSYYSAYDKESFEKAINNGLGNLKEIMEETGCLLKKTNALTSCRMKKSNTITSYRFKKVLP